MRTLVENALPRSLSATTRECAIGIHDQIADHASELCKRDGGAFEPSAETAILTAIQYCQAR
jgi:hypothetical protein